jgi:uncharacterized protein (DUF2132 family)
MFLKNSTKNTLHLISLEAFIHLINSYVKNSLKNFLKISLFLKRSVESNTRMRQKTCLT